MMFRGVVLLVCILVAQSFAIDVEGIPSKVCGNQTFSTTYATTNPITFSVSSSNPKITVSPASVTYTASGVVPITVRCGELGPAEITFRSSGANPVTDSVYLYCFGLLNVANPIASIHRGNTFELILELYPTPVQRVEVLIDSYSPLVIPGAERAIFGIEQDVANAIFYVPAGGDVGTARIVFKSRSLRDYIGPDCQDLVFSIDVQGEIASNVSSVLANSLSYTIEVEISPPPLVETEIFIHSFDGIAPASILFAVGDKTQTFEYTVTAAAGAVGCIDFSGTYYETTTSCFNVIGSITTNINTDINTFAVESFSVFLNPGAPTGGVALTITASDNLQVASSLFFQEGDNVETFQIVGVDNSTGPGFIEFSAPGYSGLRVELNVIQVECDYGYTISRDGTFCLECPSGLFGSVCTFSGDCVYSSFAYESARCVCYQDYFGPECEFYSGVTESGPNVLIVPFEYSGTTIVDKYIPLTVSATFTIPPGIVQDGEAGEGTAYIVPVPSESDYYYYNVAVDPTFYALEIDGDEVTLLESGFVFEIAAADNTALENFRPPVLSKFVFHPLKVSQAEFLQSTLYYFNETASEWVTALSICPAQYRFTNRDLLALSYGTYLCKSGQYQFFVVAPEPYHKVVVDPQPDDAVYFEKYFIADLYLTGTGLGGEAPPLPPQPVFRENVIAEAILDPGKLSPPKMNYLYESVSPASSLVVSVVTLFVAVLLVL